MSVNTSRESELNIDLGKEVHFVRLEATEGLSQPFHFEIDLFTTKGEINLIEHVGKTGSVTVTEGEAEPRYFHGVLVDGTFLYSKPEYHDGEDAYFYRITLKPQAFVHEHNRNYRIFDKKTTQEVLTTVLKNCDIKFLMSGVSAGNVLRPYCVQYGESDFGFASRLMEEEGIYYYYRHEADRHTLVMCDSPTAHSDGPATPLVYRPETDELGGEIDGTLYVVSWQERVSTGAEAKVLVRDFDFKKFTNDEDPATTKKESSPPEGTVHPQDALKIHQYPIRTYDEGQAVDRADAILQSRRANRMVYTGESYACGMQCGTTFTLAEHQAVDRYNASYLVTNTRHGIATETYRTEMGFGGDDGVWFEAVPADTRWRAPITSRRPVVQGPESAIVIAVGDRVNGDLNTDEWGRVRVQFMWDRDQPGQPTESDQNETRGSDNWCWIRVSQFGHLGTFVLPRVGQEVLVEFINGDPDRPVITGRLYNEKHRPLYRLPDAQSRAIWRSKNIGMGGEKYDQDVGQPDTEWSPEGGNEITLEDADGAQEVMIRAEKNMNFYVTNDYKTEVKNDEIIKIQNDQKVDIENDQTIHVTGNIKITGDKQIELICGSSKITMTPSGIKIESPQIDVQSSGPTTVDAKANLTLKGVMVMIN